MTSNKTIRVLSARSLRRFGIYSKFANIVAMLRFRVRELRTPFFEWPYGLHLAHPYSGHAKAFGSDSHVYFPS